MMRYITIFLLQFQRVFEQRGRSFIYFLMSLFGPLIFILFWNGVPQAKQSVSQTSLATITSYYLLLVIAAALLMSHCEGDVAREDIYEGGLYKYLLKPFSYYWERWLQEIPYRVIQGGFGGITLVVVIVFFHNNIHVSNNPIVILLSITISILAYFLAFTFKILDGFIAFWVIDYWGIQEVIEVIIVVLAGYIIPISLMPHGLELIAKLLPFSYMIYYPVVAFQGQLQIGQLLIVISIQVAWLLMLSLLYKILWKKGVKVFIGVGQ